MKIFVTGARGFTGRHFVQLAEAMGCETYASKANLLDPEAMRSEPESFRPDHVVHLAAISYVGFDDSTKIYQVNVIGTENLIKSIKDAKLELSSLLIASSANIYGAKAESPIAETSRPEPVNHYAISKLASEFNVKTYEDQLPLIITRPFNYTGAGQAQKFLIPKIVHHFKE